MKTVVQLLSFDNPVFKAYLFYCALLVLKVMLMAPLTARLRLSKGVSNKHSSIHIKIIANTTA